MDTLTKKYFSKALFFQQMKVLKWGFAVVIVAIVMLSSNNDVNILKQYIVYNMYSESLDYGMVYLQSISLGLGDYNIIIIILICALFVIASMGINKNKSYMFFGSQPITKTQIVGTKGIMLMVATILGVLTEAYLKLIIYFVNRELIDLAYDNYLQKLAVREILLLAIAMFFIVFFVFVHGIYSNGLVASVLGVGLIFYFPIIVMLLNSRIVSGRFMVIKRIIMRVNDIIFLRTREDADASELYNGIVLRILKFANFEVSAYKILVVSLLIFISTAIFWVITIKVYKNIDNEKVGVIFTFDFSEKFFKILVSIGFAIVSPMIVIIPVIVALSFTNHYYSIQVENYLLPACNIISLFTVVFWYWLQGKIINRFKHN